MPLFDNNVLDDPVVYAASVDFRGGMNSTVLPHLLQDNQYAEAKNMQLTKSGRLATRPGSEIEGAMTAANPIKQLVWFDTVTGPYEELLAVHSGELKKWDGSTFTTVGSFPAVTGEFSAFQFFNKVVFVMPSAVWDYDGATLAAVSTTGTAGNIACAHGNRVLRAGDTSNPETLYISNLGAGGYATWGSGSMASLDIGAEGEIITGLKSWDVHNLLVFKERSTYLVQTTTPQVTSPTSADWIIQPISSTIGCVAHKTAVQVGSDIWWLSQQGVVSVRRLRQETQREIQDAVSTPIQAYIDRINWSVAEKSAAVFHDNKYILSVALDSATEPDHLLVYDTYHQVWSAYWTGLDSASLAVAYFSNEPLLHVGGTTGNLIKVDPDLSQDDGADLPSFVHMKAFNFNEPISPKSLLNIELEFQDSTALADLNLNFDGSTNDSLEAEDFATGVTLLTFPWTFPITFVEPRHLRKAISLLQHRKVRQVQPKLSADSGILSLRSAVLSGFVETMLIETP